MGFLRRYGFLIAVNFGVVITLSILASVLGVNRYLTAGGGLNITMLMMFCLVWGFGGAFISLMMSKFLAKKIYGITPIDPRTATGAEREIVEQVHQMSRQAGLRNMPEVGIYDSPEVNAFATGPSKNNALVAVSTGLLRSMDKRSVDGVIGHEVAHVANGDMVTMTLITGVVNAFTMFLSRIIAFGIDSALRKDEDESAGPSWVFPIVTIVLDIVFAFLAMPVINYFSRQREYRADRDGARLAGVDGMIGALRALQRLQEVNMAAAAHAPAEAQRLANMKIASGKDIASWFSTHPSLEDRISRLERLAGR
jgi:heat shock protein HtpX